MFPQAPWVSPGYPVVAWGHPGNLRDLQRSSEIQGFRGCLRVTMAIGVFSDGSGKDSDMTYGLLFILVDIHLMPSVAHTDFV